MINLREWFGRNALRPLAYAIGTILCLHVSYLGYLAHDEYAAQLHQIDRVVQTASLGIQQDNRSLIESTLLMGLHNADAAQVALCRGEVVELLYPPSTANPCSAPAGGFFRWTIRRKAIGVNAEDFVFVVNGFDTFAPLVVFIVITLSLALAIVLVLGRARRRFQAEILDPLRLGLNDERSLEISELDELRRKNQEHNALSRRQAVSDALVDLSAQVAHDIRSPLAALEVASGDTAQLPEQKRVLIRSAVGRIRDIANSLIERNRVADRIASGPRAAAREAAAGSDSGQLLSSLVDSLVTEKRLQFRSQLGVEIDSRLDASSYGLFTAVPPPDLKRVISNLINNAVEALPGKGLVTVRLASGGDGTEIRVRDNGKGIPAELLARLGQRGETHGKSGGSGLGLHHAKASVESWGGSLTIESEPGKGATVTIRLPLARPPEWFVSALEMTSGAAVVVLDDDTSIHQIWQRRFESADGENHGVEVLHFSTPSELRSWVRATGRTPEATLYLMDFELVGYRETGLSLAEELGIEARTILVTSRFEEKDVLADALGLKVRLIPKSLAGFVPIRIEPPKAPERLDAILIDDDPLARMTWSLAASRSGKKFQSFPTVADFLRGASTVGLETPIYVDAELGEGVDGAQESMRIRDIGFQEIYLATGHEAAKFADFKHLCGVVGKEPPWLEPSPTAPRQSAEDA